MHYNTLFEKLADPALMPVLQACVSASARPFVDKARSFSIDSTGFSTGVYENWLRQKHGTKGEKRVLKRLGKKHSWVKAHACVDTDSLAVTAVVMTNRRVGDAPVTERLVSHMVDDGYTIAKFTGDAAYISAENVELITNLDGVPYFMFRRGMNGRSSPALTALYKRFTGDFQHYMDEYHSRSLSETVFGIIKMQWGASIAARTPYAIYNWLMCRVICHNISRVVRAICEFNIEPQFWMPESPVPMMAPKQVPLLHMKATPAAKPAKRIVEETVS
jgi:transposase